MEALVDMVKDFGFVPEEEILDKHGYKRIYNDALMEMVNRRTTKFENGDLNLHDVTIKNSVEFAATLKERGVKLYLASGTDLGDVVEEAKTLGYAGLFEGGIYGAVGDVSKYSKKMVLNDIIRDNKLAGEELAVIGDGPVELRECRKVGGLAIGIASDEIRRYGLNESKRTRLIKAGAHLIIPDFSQYDNLFTFLSS
jgi:phosphoglycolate phosphatase-like HAD superfamily hydrolase